MMPGDIPCNAECVNTLCHWCLFGMCLDNEPCAAQISQEARDDAKSAWREVCDGE